MREGLKLFEISDVVVQDKTHETGASNIRRLSAVYVGNTDGFEIIHGLIDRVMQLTGIPALVDLKERGIKKPESSYFEVVPKDHPTFFPSRSADVVLHLEGGKDVVLGSYGVVHPKVLKAYDISHPCSVVEMDIAPLLDA